MKMRTTLTTFLLALGAILAGLSVFPTSAFINSTGSASAAGERAGLCGTVSAYTPATASSEGFIRIAGLTYPIASGAAINGVALSQDRCYAVCFNSAGQIVGGDSTTGYNVPMVCGQVTNFSKNTTGGSSSVTIGGARVRITPGLYLAGQDQVSPGVYSCLIPVASGEMASTGSYFIPTSFPKQVRIPALVHGGGSFQNDIFALPEPMVLTFNSDNVFVFPVNQQTFGRTVLNGSAKVEGFSYSTPNSTLQAVSCTENLWDIVMLLAANGATDGDMVTLNLLNADKSIAQQVAMFTLRNGGAEVTHLHSDIRLLDNAQLTKGIGHFVRFWANAGAGGSRSLPLSLVFSTASAAFMGCHQLAIEIKRGSGAGTTSVAVENVLLKRMALPEDPQVSIGHSLEGNTIGWFPTGRVCDFACAPCRQKQESWLSGFVYCDSDNDGVKDSGEAGIANVQIRLLNAGGGLVGTTFTDGNGQYRFNITQPGTYSVQEIQPSGGSVSGDGKDAAGNCGGNVGNDLITGIQIVAGVECGNYNFGEQCGTTTIKCDTLCWRPTQFFLTNIRYLPGGTVLISGVNANNPVGIQQATDAIRLALQGGSGVMKTLNKEYVTAQLSMAYSGGGGSPVVFNAFWSALSCSGISFSPVTLSNGVTLAPDSLLDTLNTQTVLAIKENRLNDMTALAGIWRLLNGRCG